MRALLSRLRIGQSISRLTGNVRYYGAAASYGDSDIAEKVTKIIKQFDKADKSKVIKSSSLLIRYMF